MKKFLITSSTLESAFNLFHNSRYSELRNANPANNRLFWRIGHSSSYITSGFKGQLFLFRMNGNMNAIAWRMPRPSESWNVQRLSSAVDRIWQTVAIASRLKSEYPYGLVRRISSGNLPSAAIWF